MSKNNSSLGSFILIACLIIAFTFNLVFYKQAAIGIGFCLFYLVLFILVQIAKFLKFNEIKFKAIELLYLPLFFVSLAPAFSQTPTLILFSAIFSFFAFFIVALYTFWKENISAFSITYNLQLALTHFVGQFLGFENFGKSFNGNSVQFKVSGTFLKVLLGIFLAAPILLIYLVLFASSDELFNKILGSIALPNIHLQIEDLFQYPVLFFIIFLGSLFIFTGMAFYRNNERREGNKDWKGFIDPVILLTISSLITTLLLLFVISQFFYLFGDRQVTINLGIVYSEYARRGFFEMLLIGFISFTLIFGIKSFVTRNNRYLNIALNLVLLINSGLNIVVLLSAMKRLALYTDGYGLTLDRFYVYEIILFFVGLFVFFIIALGSDLGRYLVNINVEKSIISYTSLFVFVTAMLFIGVTGFISPDSFIANINLQRFHERYLATSNQDYTIDDIDVYYLASLSSDAYVQLLQDKTLKIADDQMCTIAANWINEKQSRQSFVTYNFLRGQNSSFLDEKLKDYIDGDHTNDRKCNLYYPSNESTQFNTGTQTDPNQYQYNYDNGIGNNYQY